MLKIRWARICIQIYIKGSKWKNEKKKYFRPFFLLRRFVSSHIVSLFAVFCSIPFATSYLQFGICKPKTHLMVFGVLTPFTMLDLMLPFVLLPQRSATMEKEESRTKKICLILNRLTLRNAQTKSGKKIAQNHKLREILEIFIHVLLCAAYECKGIGWFVAVLVRL